MKYTKNLHIEGSKVISYTTHVATIDHGKRQLLVHGWWSSTTSKHINHVADIYRLEVVKDAPKPDQEPARDAGMLRSVAMVAAFGKLLCPDQKSTNDWQARMLKAGLGNRGLIMPEDWDQLPEDEKSKRLEKVLEVIS